MDSEKYVCRICNKLFSIKRTLSRHLFKFHQICAKPTRRIFVCDYCGAEYQRLMCLRNHLTKNHKTVRAIKYECDLCEAEFNNKSLLEFHILSLHINVRPPSEKKEKNVCILRCVLCDFNGEKKNVLDHMINEHEYSAETEKYNFGSYLEFMQWKLREDNYSVSNLIKESAKKSGDIIYEYFKCHRSGFYDTKPDETRIRRLKKQGVLKTGIFCPASLSVKKFSNGSVEVSYMKNHVAHGGCYDHLHVKEKKGKKKDYGELTQDTPNVVIIDSIHSTMAKTSVDTNTDMANITSTLNSTEQGKLHSSDSVNVSLWLSLMNSKTETFSVCHENEVKHIFEDQSEGLLSELKDKLSFAQELVESMSEDQVTMEHIKSFDKFLIKLNPEHFTQL